MQSSRSSDYVHFPWGKPCFQLREYGHPAASNAAQVFCSYQTFYYHHMSFSPFVYNDCREHINHFFALDAEEWDISSSLYVYMATERGKAKLSPDRKIISLSNGRKKSARHQISTAAYSPVD